MIVVSDTTAIDEKDGRALAAQRGLPIIGLIGVLLRAKDEGIVPSVAPIFEALTTVGEFWIAEPIMRQALADAGESEA